MSCAACDAAGAPRQAWPRQLLILLPADLAALIYSLCVCVPVCISLCVSALRAALVFPAFLLPAAN